MSSQKFPHIALSPNNRLPCGPPGMKGGRRMEESAHCPPSEKISIPRFLLLNEPIVFVIGHQRLDAEMHV